MTFANRTAVVTGASSGIGRALAVALAARGARVGVTARRADRLADLTREIAARGGRRPPSPTWPTAPPFTPRSGTSKPGSARPTC